MHQRFTTELKEQIPLPQLKEMRRSLADQLGHESEVISETVEVKPPYHRYKRRVRFDRYAGDVEINWVLHADDHAIAGVVINPVDAPAPG